MDRLRAAQVYRQSKQKEEQILQTNQVRILQVRIRELEEENRVLKKLLKEKL